LSESRIRKGQKEDLPRVLELINELAEYEKALDQVQMSVEQLTADGFGENPAYGFFVAESEGHIVGLALYYYRYSTWKGRRLYLEDLIVSQDARGQGYGKLLLDRIIEHAKETSCTGVMWQVLDWNESAIRFYKEKYQARLDDEWINCHVDF